MASAARQSSMPPSNRVENGAGRAFAHVLASRDILARGVRGGALPHDIDPYRHYDHNADYRGLPVGRDIEQVETVSQHTNSQRAHEGSAYGPNGGSRKLRSD